MTAARAAGDLTSNHQGHQAHQGVCAYLQHPENRRQLSFNLRDGGYDIRDFNRVLPEFGTVEDFVALLDAAHALALVDLAQRLVDRRGHEVLQHLDRRRRKFCLGVTHSSLRISVNTSEVTLSVHKWVTHREILRHFHHRIIHSHIAVRVIITQHISHHHRRLTKL